MRRPDGTFIACIGSLAAGPAPYVMVDLADIEGETVPDNRPGTGPEADNWRHRLARPLQSIVGDDRVNEVLASIATTQRRTVMSRERSERMSTTAKRKQSAAEPERFSLLSDQDLYLFNEGTHRHLADRLGSHRVPDGDGYYFAVWAPNATAVSVIGDFNGWSGAGASLASRDTSGIWEGVVPTARKGQVYKYADHRT